MKHLGILLALFACSARAAELTRVASSFEENDPFGMFLMFTFDRLQEQATITREWYQNGSLQDVTELRYQNIQTQLGIDAHIGLYKDLELHVGVPIVFQQDREWTFAEGTSAANSTLYRNCTLDPAGTLCGDPGLGDGVLFPVDPSVRSYRAGLGNFTFGIAWNPFVQKKDPSKPTWNLRFDYTAPTASLLNPTVATSPTNRGAIGDRIHRWTFSTHVSKRLNKYLEPYVGIWYSLPWRGPGYYSNCDDADASRLSQPGNCSSQGGPWVRADTGNQPQHTGGTNFGLEITAFEDEAKFQRFGFDLRGWFTYVSEGRVYNELSDPMGKLLYTTDYAQVGGQLGITGSAAEFINLRAYAALSYNTEHFLTNERIGKDLNNNGVIDVAAVDEVNPNYDYRVDRVGRRFRLQEQFNFRIQVTASFNF